MKKTVFLVCVLFLFSGCAMDSKKKEGAVWGSVIGTAAGAGIGYAIGGSKGAAIGAGSGLVVGGLTGAAIGSYMDKQEAELRRSLAAAEAASIRREQDILAVTFKSDMMFDVNSFALKPGAYDEIDRLAQVLNNYPQTYIRVEGHTDSTGSEEHNQQLSERRAQAVKNALIGRNVNPSRINTVGFGMSKPIASNDTEVGRQMNRRVTVVIDPMRG